jgi:two-component system, OmpR family, alkaline phosphatase synthesis response regulator PhoP
VTTPDATAPRYLLIVDDEDDIREIACLSLEMTEGWRIAVAPSSMIGVDVARSTHPDAILLDVMMPEMDGPSGLRELRKHASTKEIPVIFLTAKVQEADLRRFLALGVKGVIAKPFDPMTLGRQIREVLGWPLLAT